MSIAKHHAEWLSLVEVSGPFLSLPVLVDKFPQGLDAHDPEHARLLRQVHEEWDENQHSHRPDPAIHHQWIKWVLGNTLDLDEVLFEGQSIPQTLKSDQPEHGETLRPDLVVKEPSNGKALLLIQTYPQHQGLNRVVQGKPWKASPDTRMAQLLHDTGNRLGLVTNGEQWMLVDRNPNAEATGYASWYATLWLEEPKTFQAFRTFLSSFRFFGVPEDETLEALLAQSAEDQQEVTDQLGYQVRRAVEVLIQSLDKADRAFGGKLLADVSDERLYEAALTVMMRLVFLFCAEERDLLLLGDELYDKNYAVSTLREQLRTTADDHGEEVLERRHDAWSRLLTTFRAVYGGVQHERMKLPAYGGSLFDPDRFPFLEGRTQGTSWKDTPSQPLPVNNRTVLHLLEALQVLQVRLPGGGPAEPRKLSFRALDIEQIGHVYEGLLDHTAIRATEPVLGLGGGRDKEPEIPLSTLEKLLAKGEKELAKAVKKETGRSLKAIINALSPKLDDQTISRFRTACQGDEGFWEQVKPFAGLVRTDTFGYPVVIPARSVYVTAGTDRRSSGTHYTPKSLTEPIVQYTLEPLVYEGPAEGKPKEEWRLKSAAELLDLKICDMACGSGAFLVQACRYMSERLVEAWEAAEKQHEGLPRITPTGDVSVGKPEEQLIPVDTEERLVYARRIVAQRCLYGVDKNPLAAEMAKLSLWLLTLAKDKPFEFLNHAIRCGDSLVGIHDIDQLRHFSLKPDNHDTPLFKGPLDKPVSEAIQLRLRLEDVPANTVEEVQAQEELLNEANNKIDRLRCAADLLVAVEFWGENLKDKQEKVRHAAVIAGQHIENGSTDEFKHIATKERRGQRMFHWPLEFPEVFVKRGGFDAFICNPPYMGGKKIRGNLGHGYREFVVDSVARGIRGDGDLCAYFLLQAFQLLNRRGNLGMVATSSICEGDTRAVGLERIIDGGGRILRASSRKSWPGSAGVTFSHIWISRNTGWKGDFVLDDSSVVEITSHLVEKGTVAGKPHRLKSNIGKTFIGTVLMGKGFVITPEEAERLLANNPKSREVLFPYLIGKELNLSPTHAAANWVINFHDWSYEKSQEYADCFKIVEDRVKEERANLRTKQIHESDYWKFWDKRLKKYAELHQKQWGLAIATQATKYVAFAQVSGQDVYSHSIAIVISDSFAMFAALSSNLHISWAREYASYNLQLLRYATSDLFDTFPFPEAVLAEDERSPCNRTGRRYLEYRANVTRSRNEGLTQVYNRFHDSEESASDIQQLRDLQVEMDQAVTAAYGWTDLDLGHSFHETKQGVRFTISEEVRSEVLQRLLKLNHERHEEEVRRGLHGKKRGAAKKPSTGKRRRKASTTSAKLPGFDEDGED